ncbi:gamma subclass chorismate mutase AroQ [Tolypothrix sp. PCC 7910]|uniref:gamma subclass chorismate mutase AroQ n=1 Tax=Tolypothrix sp. PCC 7910 TaxID=2099387 RepID=UPI001427946A|nr:gamma subclass chorismate mutase AroQ [Tolypothrix sp. PCC 7910]QIR40563.1 gamma subclass chorismate mutase AroQ [Tolypothrix sp. PCC 7910]
MGINLHSFKKRQLLYITIIGFGILLAGGLITGKLRLFSSSAITDEIRLASNSDVATADQRIKIERLLKLIQQRLLIAHDVARWKWNHKRPIEDRKREQDLLAKVRQQATTYNLEPDVVVAFFQAQIEAGKLIQKADFQNWHQQGAKSFANVPDLNKAIRPSLDKLNTEFFSALVDINPILGCSTIQKSIESRTQILLQGDGIDRQVQSLAIKPLLGRKSTSCPNNSI